jgi:hypothetical protein
VVAATAQTDQMPTKQLSQMALRQGISVGDQDSPERSLATQLTTIQTVEIDLLPAVPVSASCGVQADSSLITQHKKDKNGI